jgi:hypothetical protein
MEIVTFGRHPGNKVVINDPLVEGYHCQIIRDNRGNFSLSDNNSVHGTFVNGRRIQGSSCLLKPSDIVKIGDTTLPWTSYFNNKSYNQNIPAAFCSLGLIVAFFLPWFSIPFIDFDIEGYKIPLNISCIYRWAAVHNDKYAIISYASYLFYLIPILAAINFFSYIGVVKSRYEYAEHWIALLCCIALIIVIMTDATMSFDLLFEILSPGFYITLGISVGYNMKNIIFVIFIDDIS